MAQRLFERRDFRLKGIHRIILYFIKKHFQVFFYFLKDFVENNYTKPITNQLLLDKWKTSIIRKQ